MITIALLVIVASVASSVESTTCNPEGYKKVGCFKRNKDLFTDLLITDLDPTHDKWGEKVDWNNLKGSLHSLACRCNEKAKKDYRYFAIGFYGECWAGSDEAELKAKIINPGAHASSACIGGDYGTTCDVQSQHVCAGKEDNEYVYEVVKDVLYHVPSVPEKVEYKFETRKMKWAEAEKECKNWHGTLVIVTSKAQNDYLKAQLKARNIGTAWIGYNDIQVEGTFGWVDTSYDNAYTNWNRGEPNGGSKYPNSDCVGIVLINEISKINYNGKWNDMNCEHYEEPSICERVIH